MNRSYVYLLVDERPDQPHGGVFYVGKGSGTRALDQFEGVQDLLEAGDADTAAVKLQALETPVPDSDEGTGKATKAARMRAILEAGGSIRIDILRQGISSRAAFDIESAVIDTLGLDEHLTNQARGHGSFRYSARVVQRIKNAGQVELVDEAVVVGIEGVWGGASELNGLIGAAERVIWENARQKWALAPSWQAVLDQRARSGDPVFLIALALHDRLWRSQVLGVWDITGLEEVAGEGRWRFATAPAASARVEAARERYVGHRLTENGAVFHAQSGVRYCSHLKARYSVS